MPVIIPDELLQAAGVSEAEAKLEIACLWFDEGKLSFGRAARFASLEEAAFELELERRGIPRHRYTDEQFGQDIDTLKRLGRW